MFFINQVLGHKDEFFFLRNLLTTKYLSEHQEELFTNSSVKYECGSYVFQLNQSENKMSDVFLSFTKKFIKPPMKYFIIENCQKIYCSSIIHKKQKKATTLSTNKKNFFFFFVYLENGTINFFLFFLRMGCYYPLYCCTKNQIKLSFFFFFAGVRALFDKKQ